METSAALKTRRFPCGQCGAQLEFKPGPSALRCPYCAHSQPIPHETSGVVELDFSRWRQEAVAPRSTAAAISCSGCAARFELRPEEASGSCPFCGGHVVVASPEDERLAPGSLLPFQIDAAEARRRFLAWISGRFWAPRHLRQLVSEVGGLRGVYAPHWTYDAQTTTRYQGKVGVDRTETQTFTDASGTSRTETRVVTDWRPVAGEVQVPFDDVLVLASRSLPSGYAEAMQGWSLPALVTYRDEYLSGFLALRYDLGLEEGLEEAKRRMDVIIDQKIAMEVGGNHQVIAEKETDYAAITFKHLLLPLWSGAYRYRGKVWPYLVHGQSGEIQGAVPVSAFKVALAVVLAALAVALIVWFAGQRG
ncbi:MAG: primosomal protein N' (replication factor Y) - superfamily II helicase [Myxococcota bacterium]